MRRALKNATVIAGSILCLSSGSAKVFAAHSPAVDPFDSELMDRLSHQPELMNRDYLEHLIGRPENDKDQRFAQTKKYYWYGVGHMPLYELLQAEVLPGKVVASTFIMHLQNGELMFADIDKEFGNVSQKFFDTNGHATQLLSFAPHSSISFSVPPDCDYVRTVKIIYNGPPLTSPSNDDMQEADDRSLDNAYRHIYSADYDGAMQPLVSRLRKHPEDGEAHYLLAETYWHRNRLNEAINEYDLALANSGDNRDLQTACVAGLYKLRALPNQDDVANIPSAEFRMVDNGRRMVAIDPRDQDKKEDEDQRSGTAVAQSVPRPPVDQRSSMPVPPQSASPSPISSPWNTKYF